MPRLKLKILLAAPRGFCAGVDRAIQIVEKCIEKHGVPVYVRHEIVHNQFVVRTLEDKGAIFDIGKLTLGDKNINNIEIWLSEYQESNAILVSKTLLVSVFK